MKRACSGCLGGASEITGGFLSRFAERGRLDFVAASGELSPPRAAIKSTAKVMRLRRFRFPEAGLIGRAPVKSRMRTPFVIKGQITSTRDAGFRYAAVSLQSVPLICDSAPLATGHFYFVSASDKKSFSSFSSPILA